MQYSRLGPSHGLWGVGEKGLLFSIQFFDPKTSSAWHSDLPMLAFQVQFWLEVKIISEKFWGACLNIFRELGRSCITFRLLGSSSKIISGITRKYLRELGRFGHYIQGEREYSRAPIYRGIPGP